MYNWLLVAVRVLLIAAAVFLSGAVATQTRPGIHPDEWIHIDAFKFFQTHWVQPPLGSPEVRYSAMGWSRVYTGEVVYLVYGRIGAVIQHWWKPAGEPYLLYRLLNVGLLLVTLTVVFFARCNWCPLWMIGMTLICIPQVVDIYGYANSDGWGLSFNVLLFVVVARMLDKPPGQWSWATIGLATLLGIGVLLSKTPFLLGLVLPAVLLLVHLMRSCVRGGMPELRWWLGRLVLPAVFAVMAAGMWNPNLSVAHAQYAERVVQMREEKADSWHKPSRPRAFGYRQADRGLTYTWLLKDTKWLPQNFKSFYGYFGGWEAASPMWIYQAALACLGLGVFLTMLECAIGWRRVPGYVAISLALAPAILAINFAGTLYHTLHVDFQPQGRYMFPAIIALFFLFAGAVRLAPAVLRWIHLLLIASACVLSFYCLWTCAAFNPVLQ